MLLFIFIEILLSTTFSRLMALCNVILIKIENNSGNNDLLSPNDLRKKPDDANNTIRSIILSFV